MQYNRSTTHILKVVSSLLFCGFYTPNINECISLTQINLYNYSVIVKHQKDLDEWVMPKIKCWINRCSFTAKSDVFLEGNHSVLYFVPNAGKTAILRLS